MYFLRLAQLTLAYQSFVHGLSVPPSSGGREAQIFTTSGPVEGHASRTIPSVTEYLGIPYAAAPIGDLRFASPQPYKSNAPIVASKFSPDCPTNPPADEFSTSGATKLAASILAATDQLGDSFSEDCLTINIWTKPQSGEKAKAVLFWIYGGGFNVGSSNSVVFNGARYAEEEDVVVVSINYRVGVFGFASAPGLPDKNVGLLDQRLAVEWVRDNIAAFGGDPKRITLFGQSAGGASVDLYSYAWKKDPIVHGFIQQSGSATVAKNFGANPGKSWYGLTQKLACGGQESGDATIKCMRGKNFTDILKAMKGDRSASSPGGANGFGPMVDNKTVFGDLGDRSKTGDFVKRPVLVGNNDNEAQIFSVQAQLSGQKALPPPVIAQMNLAFGCPSQTSANERKNSGVKAWRYRYFGNWPNQNVSSNGDPGAYHGSELGMVWGTTNAMSDVPDTSSQAKLSKLMMHAWATFAKDPEGGLSKLGWPLYDETAKTLIGLGYKNTDGATFLSNAQFDVGCANFTGGLGPLPI